MVVCTQCILIMLIIRIYMIDADDNIMIIIVTVSRRISRTTMRTTRTILKLIMILTISIVTIIMRPIKWIHWIGQIHLYLQDSWVFHALAGLKEKGSRSQPTRPSSTMHSTPQSVLEKLQRFAADAITTPLMDALTSFLAGRPSPTPASSNASQSQIPASALPSLAARQSFGSPIREGNSSEESPVLMSTGGTRMSGLDFFKKYVWAGIPTGPQQASDTLEETSNVNPSVFTCMTPCQAGMTLCWYLLHVSYNPCLLLYPSPALSASDLLAVLQGSTWMICRRIYWLLVVGWVTPNALARAFKQSCAYC